MVPVGHNHAIDPVVKIAVVHFFACFFCHVTLWHRYPSVSLFHIKSNNSKSDVKRFYLKVQNDTMPGAIPSLFYIFSYFDLRRFLSAEVL